MSSSPNWFPNLPHLDQATQDAFKRAFTGIYQAQKDIATVVAAHNATLQKANDSLNISQQTQQQVASLPAFDVLQNGTSSQLKVQASALPIHCTGFSFVATPTTITFYWDGTNGSSQIQIAWPDGTVTKVPLANLAITGLVANTKYWFYPAYNTGLNMIQFSPPNAPVASAVGTPAVAYTAANIFAASAADGDRMVAMADNTNGPITITTPASGSSSGNVGGR